MSKTNWGRGARQLLALREDLKTAVMREFPDLAEGRRAPRGAGCEKFPSGNLFVAESSRGHQKGKVKAFWFASLRSATNLYSILGAKKNWRFRILGEENFFIFFERE